MNDTGAGAAPTLDLRDLAGQITCNRKDFERLYDEVRPKDRETRSFMVAVLGAGSDSLAFESALRRADDEGWFTELGERLLRDGFLRSGAPPVTTLQAVVKRKLGFPDTADVERGGLRARARLCRVDVEIDGQPSAVTGTGYLVGPSTIVTSFHVVSTLVDPATATPRPESHRQLTVRFDHATDANQPSVYRVPEAWLVCARPPHPDEVSRTKERGVELQEPAAADALAGHLDYAVILLAGSPGAERGYYDLAAAVDPIIGGTVHLFQHPEGVQQRQAVGTLTGFRPGSKNERLDHDANSLGGSSGGLLLDGDHALVGLHQGAYGNPVINTAISAVAIRADVRSRNIDLLESSYAQAYRLADGSRPILGRTRCQEWIRRVPQPLVRVKAAPRDKGVSFTVEIMRACLPPGSHLIQTFSASELHSDALRTAELILSRFGVDTAGLPTIADANSSRGVWISNLATAFITRLAAAFPGRTVWLVIDDLAKRKLAVPDGSVQDFLSELYRRSSGFANLRIVLLGLRTVPSGFPNGLAHNEDILPPQAADVASYIRYGLTAKGLAYSTQEIDRLTRLVMLTAGTNIGKLSDYISEKVDRMLSSETEDAR
ncbi:MAG: trypsin-like peptidase domain-containing protein [Tessaracoccus sp.]|uniref:trypsin-like serine peptidase n=1 Tax=Tessaracoccus sp. TaxID=1971211 RepID=UPI001EB3AE56|nr:trypsin-like peptidase domain-containing protein [Tessaracoccus sp.]MBK7820510.1 trypsin-like peptidase domain-containing protein [Tessaracoccus sp.]